MCCVAEIHCVKYLDHLSNLNPVLPGLWLSDEDNEFNRTRNHFDGKQTDTGRKP